MTTGPLAGQPLGYCARCGQALIERPIDGTVRPYCPYCNRTVYYDPKLAVAVVIAFERRILLQRRAIDPGRGLWTFPSGYVDRGEVVEEAAQREVREEVQLPVQIDRLIGLYSRAGSPVVLAAYAARPLAASYAPGDEVSEVALFEPHALPPLAFPHDATIIADFLASQPDH